MRAHFLSEKRINLALSSLCTVAALGAAVGTALFIATSPSRAADDTGFTSGAIDPSRLPEYEVPNTFGGSGGGSGDDCPNLGAGQSAYLYHSNNFVWDEEMLCIYDLPADAPSTALMAPSADWSGGMTTYTGTKVTVTLTSPSGAAYSHDYLVEPGQQTVMPYGWNPTVNGPYPSFVLPDHPRTPFTVWVHFAAEQDYGIWSYRACTGDCTQAFAAGTLAISTTKPIYSIIREGADLNPMALPSQMANIQNITPGEHLHFRGRGYEPNQAVTVALYSTDPMYNEPDTHRQIAFYAARVTTAADGTFATDFIVGNDTPLTIYNVLVNPQPDSYEPGPIILYVNP